MLDRDRIVSQLNHPYTVTVTEEIPSTNTALKERADAPEGTTLIAVRQTGGRGRLGRQFHSPAGGLYLSTLLRPDDAVGVTCRAAVAAARAVENLCGAKIDIKWVNDLYLNGRKVAGILAEGVFAPDGTLSAVVLGIGINVGATTFPDDLQSIATSLGNEGFCLTREDVAAAFLNELCTALTDPNAMEEYRRRNLVVGREVTVLRGGETYSAVAQSITDDGHLVVRTAHGMVTLSSGEVSLRL